MKIKSSTLQSCAQMLLIGLFLAALLCPVSAMASDSSLIEQLKRELEGKSFTAEIPIAGSTCLQDQGMPIATSRLVDTEVYDNNIRYYLRADRFMNTRRCQNSAGLVPPTPYGGMYLDAQQVVVMHLNVPMAVKQITGKPDRIEIQLEEVGLRGDDAYGKIKLMLGNGYESQPLEQIETKLARVLEIPRIKELAQASRKYESVQNEISALKATLFGNVDTQRKIDTASKLIEVYKELPGAVSSLNSVAFTPVLVPDVSSAIAESQKMLAGLQQQLRQEQFDAAIKLKREKIDAAMKQYNDAMSNVKTHCDGLPNGDAKTLDELTFQVAAVTTTQQDIRTVESARSELLDLGRSLPPSDYVAKCAAACSVLSRSLSEQEERIRAYEATHLTVAKLRNMNYHLEDGDEVKLVDGKGVVMSNDVKEQYQLLDKYTAFGDLDGDGIDDAVVVLVSSSGGSGIFLHLAAVTTDHGEAKVAAAMSLGDRANIKSIAIKQRSFTVDMITHGPNDPMCCPTKHEVLNLTVQKIQALQREAQQAEVRRQEAQEKQEKQEQLAGAIVNQALTVAMLGEKFMQTSIMGYDMEAEKQRKELRGLIQRNRSLVDPHLWKVVQIELDRVKPGLTINQLADTELCLTSLRGSSK